MKCHSKRLSSRGSAWRSEDGWEASSEASLTGELFSTCESGEASAAYGCA